MSMFGQNRPLVLRTYGKQKRKVDQWFSPDLRKKAFSFSSTPSSESSITEPTCLRKRRNKIKASAGSRTSRLAKKRALKALKDLASDEENVFPRISTRRNMSARPTRRTPVLSETSDINASQHTQNKKQILVLSSSESDIDSFVRMDKCYPNIPSSPVAGTSISNLLKGRFVTHRKRVKRVQSEKPTCEQSIGADKSVGNISKAPICVATSLPESVSKHKRHSTHKKMHLENSAAKPSVYLINSAHSQSVLGELSLNDCEERQMPFERLHLCSTPSTVSNRNLPWYHEPSISEISSFACDEMDKPAKNLPCVKLGNDGCLNPMQNTQAEECSESVQQHTDTPEDKVKALEQRNCMNEQKTNKKSCKDDQLSTEFLTDQMHLDSQMEQSRERCSSVSAAVLSHDKEGFIMPSKRRAKRRQETQVTCAPSLETELASSGNAESCQSKLSNTLTSSFCQSSSSSCLSLPVLSAYFPSNLSQSLIDRLQIECLSSILTVRLEPLDIGTQQEPHKAQTFSHQPLETDGGTSNGDFCHPRQLVDTESPCSKLGQSGSSWRTRGVVKRLSSSFLLPAISPSPIPPVPASSKLQVPVVQRERTASGTSRRACVSGLSASRWSKRGAQSKKQHKRKATSTKLQENSLDYLLPARAEPYTGESACGWLQGNGAIGLHVTPLRVNISSILANFTPDSLTTHTWGRLKAALSVHKKKTVSLRSPIVIDNSGDLFTTPMSSSSSVHLLQSTVSNLSMSHCDEDISAAEKVYQECEQDGPLSFDDCIPPARMKCCVKIGEGTFGEVFSTINNTNETVALKIIPVEGDQKVNGEAQKTFDEILHEIIISKELSMLNSKENNKTNGFICLNDLHCVRGCYPSALLKAWDKFDQQKGSGNDRPDFFGNDQLFIILEFEFGGSDLESMKGKLSSLAQAKSILHQVTASLAVAEQALCFEHRDLHWGNILVEQTKEKQNDFILNGAVYSVETRGVHVNIIDYSLSRLEIDGLTVSCDISNDEELFMGQGDYQFEIYRLMKKENNNSWEEYHPHSNVLWLHYLADKLLTMRYKSKPNSSRQKALQSSVKLFHSQILDYDSATDALLHCSLFQS